MAELNEEQFPAHKDFVRKFKNHVVKLSFYPVLQQFRFILGEMLENGFTMDGLEHITWTAKPVVDGKAIKPALFDSDGKESLRHNPLAIDISREELRAKKIVPALWEQFAETIKDQHGWTLKEFLHERADFRNKLLYATDAGSVTMSDSLHELMERFEQCITTYSGCSPS